MVQGSCLCGAHVWLARGELSKMHHCHCSMCRKAHGAAFATMVGAARSAFEWRRHAEPGSYVSSPGFTRTFCAHCGSPLPVDAPDDEVFVPAGCLDADPGVRPLAHIFSASRAPWFEIEDGLPTFEAYPPGFDAPAARLPERPDSEGEGLRGSCLCGHVRFVLEAPAQRARHCHCSRCRKARGAAHASNLFLPAGGLRFDSGAEDLSAYRVPDARFFVHVFCPRCGSSMPRVDQERGTAMVPMGALDDDPGIRPDRHIYVGSKAPWYEIPGGLPRDEGAPA